MAWLSYVCAVPEVNTSGRHFYKINELNLSFQGMATTIISAKRKKK
jgi:hypothetical protein